MSVSAWIPQMIWRLGWWWAPERWVHNLLRPLLPAWVWTMPWPSATERGMVLCRVLAGGLCLVLAVSGLLNPSFAAVVRQYLEFWAAGHPWFMVADVIQGILLPNLGATTWVWLLVHACAGVALMLGLLLPQALLSLLGVHTFVMVASMATMPYATVAHSVAWVLAIALWQGKAGLYWGLDYWRMSSAALSQAGLSGRAGASGNVRRSGARGRSAVRPTPDLDDDSDEDSRGGGRGSVSFPLWRDRAEDDDDDDRDED